MFPKGKEVRYGCSLRYDGGLGACSNTLLIGRKVIEDARQFGVTATTFASTFEMAA